MSSASENLNNQPRPTYTPGTDFLANNFQHDFPSLYQDPAPNDGQAPPLRSSLLPLSGSFFDEALPPRSSPSPPSSRFLDTILNSPQDYTLPFGYQRDIASPPPQPRTGFIAPAWLPHSAATMAPMRSSRLLNGYVDLTLDPEPEPDPELEVVELSQREVAQLSQRRTKRESPTPGPSAKRLRRNDGTAAGVPAPPAKIEEIDLLDEQTSVQDVLQKQRADAIKAQQRPEEKATTFKNFTCVICMDAPTDLTATSCGHLFCHECLMTALVAGENRSGPNEPKRSQCPVCRKFISRSKTADVIPMALMKKSALGQRMNETASAPPSKVIG